MTGKDIVKALTESGLLDKDIESFEYCSVEDSTAKLVFEESSKYIEDDKMQFNDIHLLISEDGTWRSEHITWVG